MTSNKVSQVPSTQGIRNAFSPFTSPSSSILLEKTKAGIRRSTPDSEALASSDDEVDQHHRLNAAVSQPFQRPNRRPSWMNDNHSSAQRKSSLGAGEPFSPLNSQNASIAADTSAWTPAGSASGRGHSGSTSFPWGSTIWNDSQKGPPLRLAEVLPSPTGGGPGGISDEPLTSPLSRRDSTSDGVIPFAIPLEPTLKTYRSQSYSVGQLDQESVNSTPSRHAQHTYTSRNRAGSSYLALQHRPSRPSMLGDFAPDTSVFEQLREVDDDDETSTTSSEAGVRLSNNQARTIEQLAMENAILRQQALANQMPNDAAGAIYGSHAGLLTRTAGRNIQINDSVLEEPDDMSTSGEEHPLSQLGKRYGMGERRLSEFGPTSTSQFFPLENRTLENVKRGHWQSSLGFGGLTEAPQSRRHSFADVPLRHSSISSGTDIQNTVQGDSRNAQIYGGEGTLRPSQAENASYFSNPLSRSAELYRPSSSSSSVHQGYSGHGQPGRVHHFGHSPAHQGQLLYLVTFKAARAEFYYVQEGTGLDINAGDLVIVEADRGTDLGTVAHKNVDWASAKELKERYIAEHYNWLMMFSRQGPNPQVTASGTLATAPTPSRSHGSAIGGMGFLGSSSSTESLNVEIKPKMIKRLAQAHEIHMLREKEGNEAKAKRMCQQKVAEHHLNMEILDAEFQMDWKKLTFYYFADSYINFNSLVTDLFKIYKTRIWMSAINPASFVSPTAAVMQLSSGLGLGPGPGALLIDRDRFQETRPKSEHHIFTSPPASDAYQGAFDWSSAHTGGISSSTHPSAYGQSFVAQGIQPLSAQSNEHGRGLYATIRSQSPFGFQNYGPGITVRHSPHSKPEYKDEGAKTSYTDHLKAFHGLSLGS